MEGSESSHIARKHSESYRGSLRIYTFFVYFALTLIYKCMRIPQQHLNNHTVYILLLVKD